MQKQMLTVTIPPKTPGLITLLQKGVTINATAGMSIREFMIESVGFTPEYAENRVRTIFLNSSPVDDIDGVKIKDGDTVSLSGALPGICGIAMGRDTPISGFRSEISAKAGNEQIQKEAAFVTLKLFNLIASEAGSVILRKGVIVRAEDVLNSLKENAPEGIESAGEVTLITER